MVAVSVNIITKNRLNYLARAVESVRNQNFGDFEIVVIDNAGTDAAPSYLYSLGDKRIKCFSYPIESFGLSRARNFGLEKAEGKYVAILDDDDVFSNTQKLSQQYSFLESNPGYSLVGTNILVADPNGKVIGRKHYPLTDKEIRRSLLEQNQFCHSSTMFRRKDALDVGGYQQVKGLWNINEYLLWLQLGLKGKVANLGMEGTCYCVWPKRTSPFHNFKLYCKDYQMACDFASKYPNFYKTLLRYWVTYPVKYIVGKRWWQSVPK